MMSHLSVRVSLLSGDVMKDVGFNWRRLSEPWLWYMVMCGSCYGHKFTLPELSSRLPVQTILNQHYPCGSTDLRMGNSTSSCSHRGLATWELGLESHYGLPQFVLYSASWYDRLSSHTFKVCATLFSNKSAYFPLTEKKIAGLHLKTNHIIFAQLKK